VIGIVNFKKNYVDPFERLSSLSRSYNEVGKEDIYKTDFKAFVTGLYKYKVKVNIDGVYKVIPFKFYQHLDAWIENWKKNRFIQLSPRGHFKTTMFAHLFILWEIYKNPEITIALCRKSGKRAETSVKRIMSAIDNNPQLGLKVGDEWGATAMSVARTTNPADPTLSPISVGSDSIGAHPDIILMDDIITGMETEYEMDKIEEWIKTVILPFAEEGSKIYMIGTCKGANDVYMRLIKDRTWNYCIERAIIKYPPEKDINYVYKDDVLLRVDVTSEEYEILGVGCKNISFLLKRKEEQGAAWFDREYQNDPSTMNAGMIHKEWMRYYSWNKDQDILSTKHIGDAALKDLTVVMGVDLAYTESKKADWTTICVLGFDNNWNIFVLDMIMGKTESIETQYLWIRETFDRWKAIKVCMGDVAAEKIIMKGLDYSSSMNVIPRKRTTKIPKKEWFRMMGRHFEKKKVYLDERMTKDWIKWKKTDYPGNFEAELVALPDVIHDDCSDAYEYAYSAVPQSYSVSKGDIETKRNERPFNRREVREPSYRHKFRQSRHNRRGF